MEQGCAWLQHTATSFLIFIHSLLFACAAQPEQKQQQIVRELFATLTARAETSSSFIDASSYFPDVPGARIIYRQYATLYFCMVIDSSESELGILDLVQVLVETLDRHFKNVCELDIIFNSPEVCVCVGFVASRPLCSLFLSHSHTHTHLRRLFFSQVHWLVDEMIVGGLVVETNPSEILAEIEAQARLERQQSDVGQAAAAAQQRLDALAGTIRSAARPP